MLLASLFLSSFIIALGQQLGFLEVPQNAELIVGETLLLKCVANATVQDCQWSWQSLEDGPNGTITNVKTYPAFGDERRDCSVRFSTLSVEQQGFWSCGMRSAGSADFTVSLPAKILVRSHKKVEFSELKEDVVLEVGKQILLTCKTKEAVKECQWTWRPLSQSSKIHLEVKTFPAFGNESKDCSIRLSSVLIEQEGFWTCGARGSEVDFTVTRPIKISVRQPKEEVEFSELTYDIEVSVGKPLILTCKTANPVKECRWTWKPASSNDTAAVLKQFPSFGNESRDCSIRFDSVVSEQEGVWTCAARFEWQDSFTPAHPVHLSIFTGVAFVQLSQDIQIAIGEPVLLRCVTNIAVDLCRWSWQPLNRTNESSVVVKEFPAFGEEGRDCSVRFKSVLEEQEGIWVCAVRLYAHSAFTTASPPATLTLLPAVRVKFLERPEDVRVAVGESALLRCIATTALDECQWTWRPLSEPNKTELVVKKFAAFGNYSRDCSVRFRSVLREQEGLWGCTVIGPPNYTLLAAPLAKLAVYEPVPINFVQLSQDIQMPRGSPILLRCLTASAVEECKWMWQPLDDANTTETEVKRFPAFGNHSRDCSLHMDTVGVEHEGNWTCAARNPGETHFTAAPPARLTLLQPESVMVALWSAPENKVTLACRLSSPKPSAVCRWQHAQHVNLTAEDKSERFTVEYNTSVGTCTIIFGPEMDDLGQWSCIFTVDTWEIASATLMLLTAPPDEKLSWLVGVLAAMVLILTVLLLTVSVCRCRRNKCENKAGLGNPVLPGQSGGKNNPNRYTDPPAKINFQFRETPGRTVPAPSPPTTSPQHIYERVDRYVSPTTCKSIYENVE